MWSITYTLIFNFAIQTNGLSYNVCSSNHNHISSYGWISPDHEINQPLGEPLEIFCTIDSDYMEAQTFTSENLFFKDKGEIMVDPQNVTIVNETTISIYLLNEEESTYLYACFLTVNKTRASNLKSPSVENPVSRGSVSNSIATNYKYVSAISNGSYEYEILIGCAVVSVKAGPQEVENFRCILFHFSLLKCIWDEPLNSAETNYTLQYVPINSDVSEEIAECPNNDDLSKNMCTWSPLTDPPYLNIYENLNITIKGTNDYGEIEQSFSFNKFENIQPDGLSGLNAVKAMPTSINLCWQIGDLKNYPND